MLYDTEVLNENDYKQECARLLIAFENPNYKQENAIHIAKNVTADYYKTPHKIKVILRLKSKSSQI